MARRSTPSRSGGREDALRRLADAAPPPATDRARRGARPDAQTAPGPIARRHRARRRDARRRAAAIAAEHDCRSRRSPLPEFLAVDIERRQRTRRDRARRPLAKRCSATSAGHTAIARRPAAGSTASATLVRRDDQEVCADLPECGDALAKIVAGRIAVGDVPPEEVGQALAVDRLAAHAWRDRQAGRALCAMR